MNDEKHDIVLYLYNPKEPAYIIECEDEYEAIKTASNICVELKNFNLRFKIIQSDKNLEARTNSPMIYRIK